MGLMRDLGAGPVALDTAPFIYFIEEHPKYVRLLDPLFRAADAGEIEIVTSALTLLEVLVVPYRAGNAALAARYEALLTASSGLRLIELDRSVLRLAAQLRAVTRARTPDAIQLAAGLASSASALLTNDRDLPQIPGLRMVQLDAYVRS